jgi:hypothetical protein
MQVLNPSASRFAAMTEKFEHVGPQMKISLAPVRTVWLAGLGKAPEAVLVD